MYLKLSGGGAMNLKNTVLSLLDIFRLNKGRKVVEEPAKPLPPLIQRLGLPAMPSGLGFADKTTFVMGVIWEKFPSGKISKRVLHKVTRHYSIDLRGYGLFRAIPEKPGMLAFKLARA